MKHIAKLIGLFAATALCACTANVPTEYTQATDTLEVYPDVRDVVVPYNIAPMNFKVMNKTEDVVVAIAAGTSQIVCKGENGEVIFPEKKWKEILKANIGKDLSVDVYTLNQKKWKKYPTFPITIAADSIDPFVTFRLIEPSYENSPNMGLWQFSMEDGKMKRFVSNLKFNTDPNYEYSRCVNCHTTQQSNPHNTVFHYRSKGGGMVVTYNGETKVVSTKVGDMAEVAVYERWHPILPLIAFSNNSMGQVFPTDSTLKTDPFDLRSDILLYDVEENSVRYVTETRTDSIIETYPTWSADGTYLYYCACPTTAKKNSTLRQAKYDLMRRKFDIQTKEFGNPETMYKISDFGKSISKPRISPDGRYIAMTIAENGAYHFTHPDSDILIYDLQNSTASICQEASSPHADGYVTWSSNGRWLMVGSRREDGNYVRLYFSYFDKDGKAHKPFQLPHHSPTFDRLLLKNYNYPEFSTASVDYNEQDIYSVLEKNEPLTPTFKGKALNTKVDAQTGASILR